MNLSQMQMEVDTHTHTLMSGHAWSTIDENAASAEARGMKAICSTEHGPAMLGGPPKFFGGVLRFLPEQIGNIRIFKGVEYNILNFDGELDIPAGARGLVEFGIASMHDIVYVPGTKEQNTETYLKVLEEPTVDLIGHPGTPLYPCDIETVVTAARDRGRLIEINNNSFSARQGGKVNCALFADMCRRKDERICVSSDSHYRGTVGQAPLALQMLEELHFPPELIVNLYYDRFLSYIEERKKRFEELKK